MKDTAIYALPDHEAVAALLPCTAWPELSRAAAAARLRAVPGLVPLAVDPGGSGRILWGDIGEHPWREWQYIFTIKRLAESGGIGETFASPIDLLDEPGLFADSIPPAGLIFHVSRCGSTLVTKALARAPGTMMISQGGPLQYGFWAHLTDGWRRPAEATSQTLARLRNMMLAMTRPRGSGARRAFFKPISWNTLYIDLIMAAWPGTPALFLYRDPVEVIASVRRETTAALDARRRPRQAAFLSGLAGAELAAASDTAYLAACYARYLEHALAAPDGLALLDYRDLSAASFARVVEDGLDVRASEAELQSMLEQFRFHSKDDSDSGVFREDRTAKQHALSEQDREIVTGFCREPMKMLANSPRNLFECGGRKQDPYDPEIEKRPLT